MVKSLSSVTKLHFLFFSEEDDVVFTIISLDGKSWDFESTTADVSVVYEFYCLELYRVYI